MTKREFADRLIEFDKQYRTNTIPAAAKLCFEQAESWPIEAMDAAINRILLSHSNPHRPPSMGMLAKTIEEEGRKIQRAAIDRREQDAKQEKHEFRQGQARAFSDGRGQEICRLIRDRSRGRLKGEAYIKRIEEIHAKYPSLGYDKLAEKERQQQEGDQQ